MKDNSIITVDLEMKFDTNPVFTSPGKKSLFGATLGVNGELAKHPIMVKYHYSSAPSCGCSPLTDFKNSVCDASNVCGGASTTLDCNKNAFGSAIYDNCGDCSGGKTGISPKLGDFCLKDPEGSSTSVNRDQSASSFIIEVILLSTVVCFMSCAFYTLAICFRFYLVRNGYITNRQPWEENVEGVEFGALRRGNTGLTDEEYASLGMLQYDRSVYRAFNRGNEEVGDIVEESSVYRPPLITGRSSIDALEDPDLSIVPPAECSICLSDITEGQVIMLSCMGFLSSYAVM